MHLHVMLYFATSLSDSSYFIILLFLFKNLTFIEDLQTLMYSLSFLDVNMYRVRQKYLMILQNSCEWNHRRGEFVLEHSSIETQNISVAMERWSVEHRAFAVETI